LQDKIGGYGKVFGPVCTLCYSARRSMNPTDAATPGPLCKPQCSRTLLIGIAGASGSGKSYLAERVANALRAPVLSLDSYYRDLAHLPLAERATQNFDHPDALDWSLLLQHLGLLAIGQGACVPTYDFETHTRTAQVAALVPTPYLVLEGIHALYHPAVRELLTLQVFVDLPAEVCLERRLERDVRDRGRTPESVHEQYERTVLPMYHEFVLPCRAYADVSVPGDNYANHSAQVVLNWLRRRTSGIPHGA
jgi:uridine kinase